MRTPGEAVRELKKIYGSYIKDNKPLYRAVSVSRDISAAVRVMESVAAQGDDNLSVANLEILQRFPKAAEAVPSLDVEPVAAALPVLQELRPWIVRKDIAEGLLDDLRQPMTGGGLMELDNEGSGKNSPLKDYAAWKKALDKLKKEVGIEFTPVRGVQAPRGLNPDGVLQLSLNELKTLAAFPHHDHGSRKLVKSSRAQAYLDHFYKQFAPLLLEIVHDSALNSASKRLTAFWQKHVESLADITKDNKYSQFKQFVEHMSQLAKDPTFFYHIGTGFAKGEHFEIDTDKLLAAIDGRHPASSSLPQLNYVFKNIERAASGLNHWNYESRARRMQEEYFQDVRAAMDELKDAHKALEAARADHNASAQYRAYS